MPDGAAGVDGIGALAGRFAADMARLAPFEPAPALAAAVSGGADSLALALLAQDWVAARNGSLLALVVDHGLRRGSAFEVALTAARLRGRGIPARILTLDGLLRGPGLAARARSARYAALGQACAEGGILHLLLGHHAGDQAETLRMRQAAASGARGLACMAGLVEDAKLRLLRPLLAVPGGRLRSLLRAEGLDWVEDPSNRDPATLRARLRRNIGDPSGEGEEVAALLHESRVHGAMRAREDDAIAVELAARVRLHPSGWAVLRPGALSPAALSALLCTVAGRRYPAATAAVARLAASPRPATLAGVRLLPAGRAGAPGDLLVVREAAAMAAPVAALPLAVWDGRFQLSSAFHAAPGMTLGALGEDAARLRASRVGMARNGWPGAVLQSLPALRRQGELVAVPWIDAADAGACGRPDIAFCPALALATAPFLPI